MDIGPTPKPLWRTSLACLIVARRSGRFSPHPYCELWNEKRSGGQIRAFKAIISFEMEKMTNLERAVLEKLLTGKADTLSGADREGTNVNA